jgi:hypothetical protein
MKADARQRQKMLMGQLLTVSGRGGTAAKDLSMLVDQPVREPG